MWRDGMDHVLTAGRPSLFLSPHLDDAVLSCGALIDTLATRQTPVVATIFTDAGPAPHTFAARSFLRQCAASSAESLFADRRDEDVDALSQIGAEVIHLEYPDALFRRRGRGPLERLVPELYHRYPTYRFDIARGRIAGSDRPMIARLMREVTEIADRIGAAHVFCPLGVGRHVDHVITRALGEQFPGRVVFYSDFPYNQTGAPDPAFIARHRLEKTSWEPGSQRKEKFIRAYRSQVGGLFPGGRIPAVPEIYYSVRTESTTPR
jgi:LmbE family N-acetylglucosaminyl deacetylase